MTWRLGIDIGGTFTDFALFGESGSEIAVLKRLTTPADPSIAVIEGSSAIQERRGRTPGPPATGSAAPARP